MAIRTNYELIDILSGENDFSISATDLSNTTKIISSTDNTLQYFKHKYGTRIYSTLRGVSPATKSEAYNDFSLDFRAWVSNRQHNIDKLYQSMFDYEYSPIENVDRYENETINTDTLTDYGKTETRTGTDTTTYGKTDTTTYGKTDTTTYGKTDTTTYGKTDTTTYGKTDTRSIENIEEKTGYDTLGKSGAEITENTKAGFNSPNSYTPDSKSVTNYESYEDRNTYNTTVQTDTTDTNTEGGSDSLASTGSDTNRLGGTDSLASTGSDTNRSGGSDSLAKSESVSHGGEDSISNDTLRTLRVHGNIGVTSNVDLLEQEERYRLQSLVELLLDNFINDYTFYC